MKSTLLLLFAMLLCMQYCSLPANAQNNLPYIPSPQTWDFMAYGNVPIGYYTGRLDLQIPIYHYKDKDFDIPISIGYNSAGFVPSKPAGPIGLNWFLNCGGVITRKIMGFPDDKLNNNQTDQSLDGFIVGKMNYPNEVNNEQLFNFTVGNKNDLEEWHLGSKTLGYETSPDIFSFNFMGYSGKFMMGHDRQVHVWNCVGSGSIKVNLDGVPFQPYYQNVPKDSEIRIVTGDGYTYIFGGSRHNLEYYYPSGSPYSDGVEIISSPVIVAWYLSKIIAPNGRAVNFEYDSSDPAPDSFEWYHTDSFIGDCYIANAIPNSSGEIRQELIIWPFSGKRWRKLDVTSEEPHYQLMRAAFIKNIAFDTRDSIKFTYSKKQKADIHDDSRKYYVPISLKIDKINVVESHGRVVREAQFTTNYKGATGKERLFLDKLAIKGEGDYTFEYALRINYENLPSTTTRTVDYWGFWKGGDNIMANMFPGLILDEVGNITYTDSVRATDTCYAEASLLKKITYPTGGYTMVDYESHDYSARLDRKSDNSFMPKLYDVCDNAGGARVKKIVDNDGISESKERTFEYIYKKNGLTVSSGIAMSWLKTLTSQKGTFQAPGIYISLYLIKMNASGFSINCTDAEHIAYKRVIERFSDGSYIIHENSHYDENRADDTVQNRIAIDGVPDSFVQPFDFWINFFRQPNDKSLERGKHVSSKYYNNNDILLAKDTILYNRCYNGQIFTNNEPFITSINISGHRFYSYKNYIYSYLPIETRKTIYDTTGNNPITTISKIEYNTLGLEHRRTESQSDGGTLISYIRYPNDIAISRIPIQDEAKAVKAMQNSMKAIPIEQIIKFKKDTDAEHFLSTKFHAYTLINGFSLPKAVYTLSYPSVENINYTPVFFSSGSLTKDSKLEQETSYDLYDSKGNLLQATGRDNIPVSYVWGYSYQYPIAQVTGAAFAQVKAALERNSDTNNDMAYLQSYSTGQLSAEFEKLRQNLPHAQISTYTYLPQVGMTSETAPDGTTTFYEYDAFGRLQRVKDHLGNILQQYEYQYGNP